MDYAAAFDQQPTAYLVMTPDLVIRDANAAYLEVLGRTREELVGRPVFEAFPPAPGALDDEGRNPLQTSFERARDTGLPDQMPLFNYDVHDPATGELTQRYWSLISAPVLDDDGRTTLVLQRVEDVTDYVRDRRSREAERALGQEWERRVEVVEADLFARVQELRRAREAELQASTRLAALADVALRLTQAQTTDELTAVVVEHGLAALGADGGAVAVRDGSDLLRLAISGGLGEAAQRDYALVPLDGPLPPAVAARTGERVLLGDETAAVAHHPQMADVVEATGCVAWAALPLVLEDELLGSLSVGWSGPVSFTTGALEVLDALAAQCAHGLGRIRSRQAERESAAAALRMSETLQRSLLTEPPQPDDLQIVVRYRPAASEAQVGGDWYDAFVTADGTTCVVIGDVAGHDRDAAAAMGQLRNTLRGVAYALEEPPAQVLTVLDRALRDLAVGSLATAVLLKVHRGEEPAEPGRRTLRWSNAGHPPPLLREADGTVHALRTPADLLLGLDAETDRADHEVVVGPGATLLLYTDGLVERRDSSIDDGLAWLEQALGRLGHLDGDALCDALLDEVAASAEDDIALLVLRT